MATFTPLQSDNDLKEIIKSAFDTELDISGSWGYTREQATIIHSTTMPISQFEHIFASMRAYVEMNMTQEVSSRYGSINLNETFREELLIADETYHKITYKLTAMPEELYIDFISEYKEQYGRKEFDLNAHFKKREKATLSREVTHWFNISRTIN